MHWRDKHVCLEGDAAGWQSNLPKYGFYMGWVRASFVTRGEPFTGVAYCFPFGYMRWCDGKRQWAKAVLGRKALQLESNIFFHYGVLCSNLKFSDLQCSCDTFCNIHGLLLFNGKDLLSWYGAVKFRILTDEKVCLLDFPSF